jgi:hypothetical protein
MELIQAYLMMRPPFALNGIDKEMTFVNLSINHWYADLRSTDHFCVYHKYFRCDEQWYRVLIRFEQEKDGTYSLSYPTPFIIVKTSTEDGVLFTDQKVYHGKRLGGVLGYINAGIPFELIQEVYCNLADCLFYLN